MGEARKRLSRGTWLVTGKPPKRGRCSSAWNIPAPGRDHRAQAVAAGAPGRGQAGRTRSLKPNRTRPLGDVPAHDPGKWPEPRTRCGRAPPHPLCARPEPRSRGRDGQPRVWRSPRSPHPRPPPPAPAPHQFVLWEEGRAGKRERHVTTLPSAPHGAPSLSKANIPNVSRLSGNNKAA